MPIIQLIMSQTKRLHNDCDIIKKNTNALY